MFGIGSEIFVAAAEEEEVEDGVAGAFGGGARREGAEGFGEGFFAEAIGGVDARMRLRHRDAQNVGRVEAKALARFLRAEGRAGGAVEEQGGFEVGAGARPLDPVNAGAEIEALGGEGLAVFVEGFGRGEEAAQGGGEGRRRA